MREFGESYRGTDERDELLRLYARMVRIRAFEESLQELFAAGKLPGFVHLYVGEEAIAVGACSVLTDEDKITSTHRGHGHLIAKGANVGRMMAEIMGRSDGYCRGKGGSMHIVDYTIGILGANGIVGGGIPIATGSAMADSMLKRPHVTICFFGDGASNQGVLHEAMNISARWSLPVIFLCENNGYTEWMRTEDVTAGAIADRGKAFGLACETVDGNDVLAVKDVVGRAVNRARAGEGPSLIEARTFRILAHNEGEEVFSGKYRDDDEIEAWRLKDPILQLRGKLIAADPEIVQTLDEIESSEKQRIADAVEFAMNSPHPELDEIFEDLYSTGVAR